MFSTTDIPGGFLMDDIDTFTEYLKGQDRADLTVKGYQSDMNNFIRWFEQTNGESFAVKSVTPTDIREYRRFLLGNEHRKASTVNRRLAALSVYMNWAKQTGLIAHDPTQDIRPGRSHSKSNAAQGNSALSSHFHSPTM
jgi:integrase/recombinase XerC